MSSGEECDSDVNPQHASDIPDIIAFNFVMEPVGHMSLQIEDSFPNSTLLAPEHKDILNGFYKNPNQRWALIYKASRDGFDAVSFHSCCNNNGRTMTIIKSDNDYLFGGYTSVSWTSSGSFESDDTAFLFTLTNPHNISPTKYPVLMQYVAYAVCHNGGYGPTFGCGTDLYMATNSNSNTNSSIGFPKAYLDTTNKGCETFTGTRAFTTSDIEVFKPI